MEDIPSTDDVRIRDRQFGRLCAMKPFEPIYMYREDPAVLTSTHNICFRAKLRKNVYPCKLHFYYIKVGLRGYTLHGHVSRM